MPVYIDQLNRKVELSSVPRRIVSLVPSQTELLYDLGLKEEVVGITKFCIHPEEWFRTKTRVGGTKKIDHEKIKQLQPDLIIGNKEENEKADVEELMQHYNVWMSDISNIKEAFDMITRIGAMIGKQEEAVFLKLRIETAFNQLSPVDRPQRTAYFIWNDPYMVAGGDTFINDMMSRCGLENIFSGHSSRYPIISTEELKLANPELILLSSEPFPFKEKHIQELKNSCPDARYDIVDGELFSWYGSRLLRSPEYFSKLIQKIVK